MGQLTFAELEHDAKKRKMRLEAWIAPFYPKAGRGRRPYPLRTMLRMHSYNPGDPGMEDLLCEAELVRRFEGRDAEA